MGTNKLCLYEVELMTFHCASPHLQEGPKLTLTRGKQTNWMQLCFLNKIFSGLPTVQQLISIWPKSTSQVG